MEKVIVFLRIILLFGRFRIGVQKVFHKIPKTRKRSKNAYLIQPIENFQNVMVDENENFINYPQGFPQDVENCGKEFEKSAEKSCVLVVKSPERCKHVFFLLFRDVNMTFVQRQGVSLIEPGNHA